VSVITFLSVTRVAIYTTPYCGYCVMLKRLMQSKSVVFEEIDVSEDVQKRRWLAAQTGQRTVPQLFIDDRSYGGYTEAVALDRRGELDRLLAG
jgi:glutaredoxin 3